MRKMLLALVTVGSGLGMLVLFGAALWLQWMPKEAETVMEWEYPMAVADTELLVLALTEYRGPFPERPEAPETVAAAAALIENRGGLLVSAGAVVLQREGEQLVFELWDLPPGESALVVEKDAQAYTGAMGWDCCGWTREEYPEDWGWLKTEQLPEGLAVTNGSEQLLPAVELTWKRKSGDTFIGGISFRCMVQNLAPGETKILPLSGYEKGRMEVVKTIIEN